MPQIVWYRVGSIASPPVVASGRGLAAHVFALDERQAVRYFKFSTSPPFTVPTGSSHPGVDLGGQLIGPPAAYAQGQNVHLFGRGLNEAFWDNRSSDGGRNWSGWRCLGGVWRSIPSVAVGSGPPSRMVVVGGGQDERVWALTSSDGGENFTLGRFAPDPIVGQPIASTDWRGRGVCVYASFPDGLKISSGGEWTAAGTFGGSDVVPILASDPVAVADGSMENVLGRDTHGQLWMYAYADGRGGNGSVTRGSLIAGKPAVAIQSFDGVEKHVIVVARAPDGQLYRSRVSPGIGGDGVGFTPLGVSASSDPAVIGCFQSHSSLVFARDGDHLLYGVAPT